MLLDDFATCFVDADLSILSDIYFSRDTEADRQSISAAYLVPRVNGNGQQSLHLPTFELLVRHLKTELRPGDVMVTMGAGNVWEIGRELASDQPTKSGN